MTTILEKFMASATADKDRARADEDFLQRQAWPLLERVVQGYMNHFNNRGLFVFLETETKNSDYGKYIEIRAGVKGKPAPDAQSASVRLNLPVRDMAEVVAARGYREAARHYTDILCKYTERQLEAPCPPAKNQL